MVSKIMLIFKFYTYRHDLDPNQLETITSDNKSFRP